MENKKVENKKQMSNKKKFWVGMSALAAVGIITTTVAWFTSSHQFGTVDLNTTQYSVYSEQLIDEEKAKSLVPGRSIEAKVSVENHSTVPILARLTYTWNGENGVNLDNIEDWKFTYATTSTRDSSGEDVIVPTFGYNEDDGAYYFKGLIPEASNGFDVREHLQTLTYTGVGGEVTDKTQYKVMDDSTNRYSWQDQRGDHVIGEGKTYTIGDIAKTNLSVKVETIQATDVNGKNLGVEEGFITESNGYAVVDADKIAERWHALENASKSTETGT